MTPNVTLILVSSVLIGTGVYLFLSRSLVRALMGFLLIGNGINLLFVIGGGPSGAPPIVGAADTEDLTDPVPQALVLTAIVITLAMTAFVLALAHRAWQLGRQDLVDDDFESARIHERAVQDDMSGSPSAREQAEQIQAETERTEREMSETDSAQAEAEEAELAAADLATALEQHRTRRDVESRQTVVESVDVSLDSDRSSEDEGDADADDNDDDTGTGTDDRDGGR